MEETNSTADQDPTPSGDEGMSEVPDVSNPSADGPQVAPFDLTETGGLSEVEAEALRKLHIDCSTDLARSIGGAIDLPVAVELTSIRQQPYRQLIEELPAETYVSTSQLRPLGEDVAIWIDNSLAVPLIDLLLGGSGETDQSRVITIIEAEILEKVVALFSRALQAAWRPALDQAFVFGGRLPADETAAFMSPGEPALLLGFEVKLPESVGNLSIVVNPVVSNALMRQLLSSTRSDRRPERSGVSERLRHHVLKTPFAVDVMLTAAPVPARKLIGLKVGDVLALPHPLDEPAVIVVGGKPLLSGIPVQHGAARGVEVLGSLDSTSTDVSEASA